MYIHINVFYTFIHTQVFPGLVVGTTGSVLVFERAPFLSRNFIYFINYKMSRDKITVNILSFNERSELYNETDPDLANMLKQLITPSPTFIIIGTQESRNIDKSHFQRTTGKILEQSDYLLLGKCDTADHSFPSAISSKLRTRIYYDCREIAVEDLKLAQTADDKLRDAKKKSTSVHTFRWTPIDSSNYRTGMLVMKTEHKEDIQLMLDLDISDPNSFKITTINSHILMEGPTGSISDYNPIVRIQKIKDIISRYKLPEAFDSKFNIVLHGDLEFKIIDPNLTSGKSEREKFSSLINVDKDERKGYMKSHDTLFKLMDVFKITQGNKDDEMLSALVESNRLSDLMNPAGPILTCNFKKDVHKDARNPDSFSFDQFPSVCDRILFRMYPNVKLIKYEPLYETKSDHAAVYVSLEVE
jgi:hypothetical protein